MSLSLSVPHPNQRVMTIVTKRRMDIGILFKSEKEHGIPQVLRTLRINSGRMAPAKRSMVYHRFYER